MSDREEGQGAYAVSYARSIRPEDIYHPYLRAAAERCGLIATSIKNTYDVIEAQRRQEEAKRNAVRLRTWWERWCEAHPLAFTLPDVPPYVRQKWKWKSYGGSAEA